MPRSMTAYARKKGSLGKGSVIVELHSVNKRGLEMITQIPKDLMPIDVDLRQMLSKVCRRGQVNLRLVYDYKNAEDLEEVFDIEFLKQVNHRLRSVAENLGFQEKNPFSLEFVLDQAQKFAVSEGLDKKQLLKDITPIIEEAVTDWIRAKEKEGAFLAKDIESRLEKIEGLRLEIAKIGDDCPKKAEKRLKKALEDLAGPISEEDHNRILKEVVIYADKLDITEELTRMHSHIIQFREVLSSSHETSIGKMLDFLVQEILRESNSIASKVGDIQLVQRVLEIKRELEKIREQVQNIE